MTAMTTTTQSVTPRVLSVAESEREDEEIVLCAHCATPVPDDARYCHACGSLVSDAEGQASASASLDRQALLHLENLLRAEAGSEFEIMRQLGRGGMAVVFLAREHHLARLVAIKVLPPELTFGHGVERFKREARTAAALDHPNIIPIYRIGAGGVLFWYAMKYVEGHSLDEVLRERGRLPLAEAIPILAQVADALDFAHQRGVVHRDVKPANVLLDPRDRAIVTDFGIAKALAADALTASGSAVGTPYYMSPEQWLGRALTGAADQYSVAVMAYRMLSGHVPFEGESAVEVLQKHCTAPVPPLEALAPDLPAHVCAAIYRALDKEPQGRFPSLAALVNALGRPSARIASARSVDPGAATELVSSRDEPATVAEVARAPAVPPAPANLAARARAAGARRAARRRRRRALLAMAGLAAIAGGAGWIAAAQGWIDLPRLPRPSAGAVPTSAPEPPAPAPPATSTVAVPVTVGVVVVTGLPAGATVEVAGEPRAPVFELLPGRHSVELRAPGFAPQVAAIDVVAGDSVRVPFAAKRVALRPSRQVAVPTQTVPGAARRMAVLRMQVTPPGRVVIDGVDFGERRTFVRAVTGGVAHTVSVIPVRGGYVRKDTTLTPAPGDTVTVRISLEVSP